MELHPIGKSSCNVASTLAADLANIVSSSTEVIFVSFHIQSHKQVCVINKLIKCGWEVWVYSC